MDGTPEKAGNGHAPALAPVWVLIGLAPLVFLRTGGQFENHPKSGFLQWGIALLALLWIAGQGKGESTKWDRTPLDGPLLMFLLACLLSLTRAVNVYEGVPSLLHWGAGVLLFFLLVQMRSGPDAVPQLFLVSSLGCGAVSIIGIAQAWFGLDWIPQAAPPAGTFANRNMASHYIAICFPLILGLIVLAKSARVRILGCVCLVLSTVYLVLARTLSAWLAVLLVILACTVGLPLLLEKAGRGRIRGWLFFAVSALLIGAAVVGLLTVGNDLDGDEEISSRLISLAGMDTGTGELRLIFWKNTVAMARDHPLLGVGPGNFKLLYPLYHRTLDFDWTFDEEHQLQRAHNDHLQILAELGLVGLAAWITIFGSAFALAWRLLRGTIAWIRLPTFFVSLGLVALLVVAGLSFPLERAMPPIYLCALLGMLGSLHVAGCISPKASLRVPPWTRRAGALILIAFLAASVAVVRKAVLSDIYFTEGVRLARAGEHGQAVVALEKARRVSPRDGRNLLMLAGEYAGMENWETALERLREVLRVRPHDVNAFANMGYCSLELEEYGEAERYLREALEILPDSPRIHTGLGTARFRQGRLDPAIESYRKAVELAETKLFLPTIRGGSRLLQPRLLLANAYVARGKLPEAMVQYEKILAEEPGRQEVREILAELSREVGGPEKARK